MRRNGLFLPILVVVAVLIGASMFGPSQPSAAPPKWDVTTVTQPVGPGYRPKVSSGCDCVGCLTEADVKRIVAAELVSRGYGSAPAAVKSGGSTGQFTAPPQATVVRQRVVTRPAVVPQQAPPRQATVRTGLFGRRVVNAPQAAGTCRVVNGQVVCQ
jgi:hypothetical protein